MHKYYLVLCAILCSNFIKSMDDSDIASSYSPQELEHIRNVIRERGLQSPNWGKAVVVAPPGVIPVQAWQLPTPIPLAAQASQISSAQIPSAAKPLIATALQKKVKPIRRSERLRKKHRKQLTSATDGLKIQKSS